MSVNIKTNHHIHLLNGFLAQSLHQIFVKSLASYSYTDYKTQVHVSSKAAIDISEQSPQSLLVCALEIYVSNETIFLKMHHLTS
jgi:hypothetical protein